MTTVVVAYPWNADDALLAPLRDRSSPTSSSSPSPTSVASRTTCPAPPTSSPTTNARCGRGRRPPWPSTSPPGIGDLAPGLRWVQAIGAGIDHLDDAGLPDDCLVTNAAGVAAAPIAEFAFGRLLAVWKRFGEIDEAQRAREWKPKFGTLVEGLTLGIIGLGAIGTAVAVRARAFGMTTIGTRRSYKEGQDHPAVDELRGAADLHDVLARCDAVVVSAPGTAETENLFDADAFAAMKPGALFCNVGRGSLVDEGALIGALESGHLGAAILDVTREEPLPAEDPLWRAPNIWISPHSSAAQERYTDKLLALFADNLGRFTRGEELHNVVDRAAGY